MPFPGLGSISAIIHMLAKGPDVARSKSLMRVLGTVLLSLVVCLGVVVSVSAQNSPLLLSSISLSAPSVTEGRSIQGKVTLNMAAPAEGVAVSLAADPIGAAFVPASVKIPAGATSATFPVNTTTPTAVTIYGNYGVTKSDQLSVVPRVSIEHDHLREPDGQELAGKDGWERV